MKNPIIDVAAILICILGVVLIGQYYIHKKDKEISLQQIEKRVELKAEKIAPQYPDWSKFEVAVKRTE